jgi:tetratricopeptide (TPR) repeat protein
MLILSAIAALEMPVLASRPSSQVVTTAEAMVRSRNWVSLYYQWGNSLHGQEQLEEAIQAYQSALNLDPKHPPSLINQGLTLLEMGRFERASANFNAILKLPDEVVEPATLHAIAYYNLAIIHNRRGEKTLAIKAVQSALQLTPNFSKAQLLLKQLEEPTSETPQ